MNGAQLRVNLSDGSTLSILLPDGLQRWTALQSDPAFNARVRGMGLTRDGTYFALPAPRSFRRVVYKAEVNRDTEGTPVAVRVGYQADDVSVWLTLYFSGMVRVDTHRVGRPRWQPSEG